MTLALKCNKIYALADDIERNSGDRAHVESLAREIQQAATSLKREIQAQEEERDA